MLLFEIDDEVEMFMIEQIEAIQVFEMLLQFDEELDEVEMVVCFVHDIGDEIDDEVDDVVETMLIDDFE